MNNKGKQVKILSGVSGSGKSTYAKQLQAMFHVQNPTFSVVVSADDFFMVDGEYRFNPAKLSEAHASCFRSFIEAMQEVHTHTYCDNSFVNLPNDLVIVDNTNTTTDEIAPYVLGALAFGYEPEIITITTANLYDLSVVAARNKHGVPSQSIMKQHERIIARELPKYWKAITVPYGL
jgi:predicted ABC-type ATPase